MKKLPLTILITLFIYLPVNAQSGISIFAGGGANTILFPNELSENYNPEEIGVSFAAGVNMHATRSFDLQFLIEYSHLFSSNELGGDGFLGQVGVNGKFDIISTRLKPYLVGGYFLNFTYLPGATINKQGFVSSENDREETSVAFRLGLGMEYDISRNIGIFIQSQYSLAMNMNSNFQYIPTILGVSYNIPFS